MTVERIDSSPDAEGLTTSWRELLGHFLMLGILTVGGSMAQIARMYRYVVERRRWLSNDDFTKVLEFCRLLPGPETLQIAIYIGYLKRKLVGGFVAGIAFIAPCVLLMLVLSRLYLKYANLPRVSAVLFVLKPAVLGIITAATVKLFAGSIRNFLFAAILVASGAAFHFLETSLVMIFLIAGLINVTVSAGLPSLSSKLQKTHVHLVYLGLFALPFIHPHWLRLEWLSLKTGLFSFGGAYSTLALLQQGAVEKYRWVSAAQMLDGIALTVATPGPFTSLSTFVGYLAGGWKGALLATFFVFLPSFVFVLSGFRYAAKVTGSNSMRAFLDGVSASLAGVMIVVTFQFAQGIVLRPPTVVIALIAFLAIVLLKVDVAIIAAIAIVGGIAYAFFPGTI
jgi:chromate transporter